MAKNIAKSLATWSVSKGLRLPEQQLDRVNELSSLRHLLQQLEIDCVLDVGANRGQYAQELRDIGYTGHIVSFEPISTEFGIMKKSFMDDAKWRGYQMALGSREESLLINVPKLTVMSSLLESKTAEKNTRSEQVAVKRLDAMFPALISGLGCKNVFLKMDTQGYDLEVFKGASDCISSIKGLQSELSVQPLYKNMPHYLEALAVYESAGFDLHNLSVVSRISNGGLLEMNCFMRRSN
ncbi:MAG TPA: FkbM family methyltransferase [Noviherbaspirillum sp.]|jgi:FkbM family methyltransferase|uniref:FkbM family methyltransferase n=1 Tax=Noviherbaspirillum sp. TaxID=1926288 RepID=UPI002DDCF40D|nr:FkbM family methyltransferase [Noviherbaspirillum sp.]HEV2612552.1 FkbM family methyltransferase [Noviherbaspirillum sp.]